MPATYFYLADLGLLVTAYWGVVDPQASQRVRDARAADPARGLARAHLIDLSQLERTTGTGHSEAETFRALGTVYAATFGTLPTAVLASAPHIYGLARIFETVAGLQQPPVPVRVFRSLGEAAEFLGVDLAEARREIARRQRAAAAAPGST